MASLFHHLLVNAWFFHWIPRHSTLLLWCKTLSFKKKFFFLFMLSKYIIQYIWWWMHCTCHESSMFLILWWWNWTATKHLIGGPIAAMHCRLQNWSLLLPYILLMASCLWPPIVVIFKLLICYVHFLIDWTCDLLQVILMCFISWNLMLNKRKGF